MVIYTIGSAKESKNRLYLKRKFKWGKEKIDTLGFIILLDDLNMKQNDYQNVLEKAAYVISTWKYQSLSLASKIEVVNSLICSLFTYRMQILLTISSNLESKITELLCNFIWNVRKPKIRYKWLCLAKEEGGRKLANIAARDKALNPIHANSRKISS